MKLFRRLKVQGCPPEVMDGLIAVYSDYPDCFRIVNDCFIFYALHGRDRHKLTLEWVERCRERCEDERKGRSFLLEAFAKESQGYA